ncbi:hypothetical protein [Chryseobacterium sp. PET-29]|uniref:hypothetical protein n=1 Tax=Chryseobacterium sp. PET-29 TaxID=2983267 RepID=UPI0021E5956F|nr:hypothetical protein [Chryseobacterium sp. PET-29]
MSDSLKSDFNFVSVLDENETYKLLFPPKEVGMAVVIIYEQIINKEFLDDKFTEKDIHIAFEKIYRTNIRYPKEVYSGHIMDLQEYFLDYDQEKQKYFFKDYAYKFCLHAKETLKGVFNPTRIQQICAYLTSTLKLSDNIKFWLQETFKKFEPDLREQIDFLDRQIALSIEELKSDINFSDHSFINVLVATQDRLAQSQTHVQELRAAYSETKNIRALLDAIDFSDPVINDLVLDVHSCLKYINDRLNSIDRKLDRIQPKIRKLFSTLNKPSFSSKVEKFILYLLNQSSLENKSIIFPSNIFVPQLHIDTPEFTIVSRDKELFPPKPKERKVYVQNMENVQRNFEKFNAEIREIEIINNWETLIFAALDLKKEIKLSLYFYDIIKETGSSQIAVTVLFNVIKQVYNSEGKFKLITEKALERSPEYKNITLWKMSIIKI